MELFAKLFDSLLVFVYHCFDRIVIHGYLSGFKLDAAGSNPVSRSIFSISYERSISIPNSEMECSASKTAPFRICKSLILQAGHVENASPTRWRSLSASN
jgi:hypothetical protein